MWRLFFKYRFVISYLLVIFLKDNIPMVNLLQPDCLISKLDYDTSYEGDFEKAMSPL